MSARQGGLVVLAIIAPLSAGAQGVPIARELAQLSLEQLANLEVTSVSRRSTLMTPLTAFTPQSASLLYGGAWNSQADYRVYAKYADREHTETAAGARVDDASHKAQAGFRADWSGPSGRSCCRAVV